MIWVPLAQSLLYSRQGEGARRLGQGFPSTLTVGPGEIGWVGIPRVNGEGRFWWSCSLMQQALQPQCISHSQTCPGPRRSHGSDRGSMSIPFRSLRFTSSTDGP